MYLIISTIIFAAAYIAASIYETKAMKEEFKRERQLLEDLSDELHNINSSITYHASYASGINDKLHQLGGLIIASRLIDGWDKQKWERLATAWREGKVIGNFSDL